MNFAFFPFLHFFGNHTERLWILTFLGFEEKGYLNQRKCKSYPLFGNFKPRRRASRGKMDWSEIRRRSPSTSSQSDTRALSSPLFCVKAPVWCATAYSISQWKEATLKILWIWVGPCPKVVWLGSSRSDWVLDQNFGSWVEARLGFVRKFAYFKSRYDLITNQIKFRFMT